MISFVLPLTSSTMPLMASSGPLLPMMLLSLGVVGVCTPRKPIPNVSTSNKSGSLCDSDHGAADSQGLIRIWPGDHHPLRVAVSRSSCAGRASETVSNLRSDPQSRPQSRDRYVD